MTSENYYINLLHTHLSQLKGDNSLVEETLIRNIPNLKSDTFYNIATWVWILQKQISHQPNHNQLTNIDYYPYVNYLCEEWKKPQPRIWNDGKKDIYLSNLSMAYAALLETKNTRGVHSLQKTMTEMRDFVFQNLLSGGTVLNGVAERNIAVDQVLSVMPYGLFSPEDLVMVEAVHKITTQLNTEVGLLPYVGAQTPSQAATAMLALYYFEKSDMEQALFYANISRANSKNDPLAEAILAIYDFYVAGGVEELNRIIHKPLGNENVYISQLTERIPHYPTLDDYINLACQVISLKEVKSVCVRLENESKTWNVESALKQTVKDKTILYEGKLDPLPFHENYYYTFVATLEGGDEIISDTYEISTLKKESAKQFKLISKSDNQITVMFGEGNLRQGLTLGIKESGLDFTIHKKMSSDKAIDAGNEEVSITSGDYRLVVDLENPVIKLYKNDHQILASHPLFAPIEWKVDSKNQVSEFMIHWYSPEHEKFYGFGERYNATEQRGQVIDCYVYNQYRDQGTRTYIPIPFYMTNSGYGCFVDTNVYTKFDLGKELQDKCTVTFEANPEKSKTDVHFYFGDYKEQVKCFTNDTGKPKMIPTWALGPWMSSNNWDRQSIVEQEVETTNKFEIPATVIVLEQWSDEATYYMFNDAQYALKKPGEIHNYDEMTFPEWGRWPDPKRMVDYLHHNNLKLILWQIPIQKYLNKQKHPLKDQDEAYMIEKRYVVQNADGSPYRIPENWFTNSLLMDFSHEEGTKWWFQKRQYLIDIGVDGFKTDGGEFVFGKQLKFANGQTGSEMRNQYPNDYISAYYDFAQQNNGITFSRAGYIGAQNFPAHWAGDERSTFDAFKRSLIAGINAGLAGIVFWGWDLAGFNGEIPTAELFMRSAAMAAFCPIMQYHAESKAEFSQDRTPWNIAERTGEEQVIDVYRYFANVRMNLIPYLYQEAKKASESGVPMMRALMVDYPNDERAIGLYDEYLFGDSLLVAPIIEEGSVTRNVYLPDGSWVNLWTNEKFDGPTMIRAVAKVDQIPVFVKMNQALLLNVDKSKELGSSVGNDITKYETPLCKIYCDISFEQSLIDHLGNTVNISVLELKDEMIIEVESEIKDLEIEVIGNRKPVRIIGN